MVFHAGRYVGGTLPDAAWRWGEYGVDVFFVVSGFVMMVAVPRDAGWRDFARRRAVRILPMYWLATLLMAALAWVAPQLFTAAVITLPHVVLSLLLVPHYSPATGDVAPLLVPGWTLSYELYFYAVFALFLRARPGVRIAGVALVLLLAMPAAGYFLDGRALGGFVRHPIVAEFVFGLVAGALWMRGRRCPAWAVVPAALAGIALIVGGALHGDAGWRVPVVGGGAFVLVWAMASAARVPRIATALGDASYSLYLLHPFVVGAAWFAWQRTGLANGVAFIALCVVASAIGGWIAWRVIEAPMTRRLQRG